MSSANTVNRPVTIVCIGAGPGAVMLLERLVASHSRDSPELRIDVHLVDPHHPGGGRIWRREQSPLLKLNSMLEDVAFFTDASCTVDGPVAPGPSLAEWVRAVRAGDIALPAWADDSITREVASIGDRDFPTRRLNNAYLGWAFDETLRRAAAGLTVEWHQDFATAVEDRAAGDRPGQTVRLASGASLDADIVVYALGHNGTEHSDDSVRLADFAARHDLAYVAPAFTADLDLSHIAPGADVIVRGMGLAAIDLTVMLTEGRGGTFAPRADGTLHYEPSGNEPTLHLGSRRGVPYRSKITSRVAGDPVSLEYLGAEFHASVAAHDDALDFERDAWPLIANELVTAFARELFTAHPDRVVEDWAAFAPQLRRVLARERGYASEELAALIAAHVPDPDDRFDLEAFDRPLAFLPGDSGAGVEVGFGAGAAAGQEPGDAVHRRVVDHIATDLRHRTSQRHSATQALFMAGLFSYLSLAEVPPQRWNARSRTQLLPRRWHTYFSYLASGPPGHRLEELIALADAGVVRFLGGDVQLEADERGGVFTASGSAVVVGVGVGAGVCDGSPLAPVTARTSVTARTLIDAWLPEARASRSENPLLRQLVDTGRIAELSVVDEAGVYGSGALSSGALTTGQIEAALNGRVPGEARQFALGPFVAGPTGGAFTRPGLDSLPFRIHDRVARAILVEAAELTNAATQADPKLANRPAA